MAVNPNWPLVVTQFSTTDPFDAAATPVWNAFTPQPSDMTAEGGRQYELDLVTAGEATYTLFDQAEALNPANTTGPYYPNIKPLRQIIDQAMWPPAPVGGAVNLLNANALPTAYDPTFDSYTAGTTPSWITAVGGTTPVVGTTTPHSGANDLTWNVVTGSTNQGVSLPVPCIPGQQYTCSAYVRQTSASTQRIFIAGGPSGSFSTTTGAYFRLSVTFTATQPVHTLQIMTDTGFAVSGTVMVDDIQHEPGASMSAFSSTGPNIFGVFGGFIERWPRSWKDGGVRGQAKLTCVDALAVLSNQFLQTEYRNAVLAKKPDYYWALSEPQGAATFAEISGNNGAPLTRLDQYGGAASFAPGTATNIPGDPSGVGIAKNDGSSLANTPLTLIQTGFPNSTPSNPGVALGGALPWTVTFAFWFAHGVPAGGQLNFATATDAAFLNTHIQFQATPTQILFNSLTVTDSWADGKPHLFVGSRNLQSGQNTDTLWVDGVLVAGPNTTIVGPWANPNVLTVVELGGLISVGTERPGPPNATYAHLAAWNRALSQAEITDLWNAGQGYPGEKSGARVSRYLGYNWIGPAAIDTGQSTMGVSNLALNTSVNDACAAVATSESGRFFVDATNRGGPAFQSRTRQYLNTSAKWVLGEQELPYEEDIEYDFDDQQIWNDVQVTRVGGVTAVGGTASAIATSQKAAGKRSYTRQVNVQDDGEAQNAANWIFNGHNQAVQRLARLSIKPSSNPALWPMALGARQGDRITVHRRTSAGTPMVADFFIEKISHDRKVSDTSMEWTVSFEASPFAATRQPWILGDATYGVLGSTTLPGY